MHLAVNILTPEVRRVPGLLAIQSDLSYALPRLKDYGYDSLELITTDPLSIDREELERTISEHGFSLVAINTGRVRGELGLSLTSPDDFVRINSIMRTKEIIDFASIWAIPVNIGILRGTIKEGGGETTTREKLISALSVLSKYAERKNVDLMIETVARPMMDFLNTLDEAENLINSVGSPSLHLMYDFSQMELEEEDMYKAMEMHMSNARHLHFADTERKVPGKGKIDWRRVMSVLSDKKYQYDASIEVLPVPDEMKAAEDCARYLLPLLSAYGLK